MTESPDSFSYSCVVVIRDIWFCLNAHGNWGMGKPGIAKFFDFSTAGGGDGKEAVGCIKGVSRILGEARQSHGCIKKESWKLS